MARPSRDEPLRPSLLDRLIDADPTAPDDAHRTDGQVIRELRESVRRDVENLLNTRRRCKSVPEDLDELPGTILDYGIPDFSSMRLGSADRRDNLAKIIETHLRRFEPRFSSVSVSVVNDSENVDRTIRLRIDALLKAEPVQRLALETIVEPATRVFEVKAAGNE